MDQVATFYSKKLTPQTLAWDYLVQRGLDEKTVQMFKMGFAPSGWDNLVTYCHNHKNANEQQLLQCGMLIKNDTGRIYDRFRNRLMFPIRDRQGRVVGFGGRVIDPEESPKYLNSPETQIFHKGSELFGLFEALQSREDFSEIIVVEGYMDVLALVQHGYRNVVATLGTATTKRHLERLFRYVKKIIFCFDGDLAGRKAAWRALENGLPCLQDGHSLSFMFLPKTEDPDSFGRKQGTDAFSELVQSATRFEDFLFQELQQQIPDPTSIAGRAQLAQLATPLLEQLPEGTFRELMWQELSKKTRLASPQAHHRESLKPRTRSTANSREPKKRLSNPLYALALLLEEPQLAEQIHDPEAFPDNGDKHIKLLLRVISQIQSTPNLTTASLLEQWRGSDTYTLMEKLTTYQLLIPGTGIKEEFLSTMRRIRHQGLQFEIEQLLNKANQFGLSDEERLKLQRLISSKQGKPKDRE